MNRLRPLSWCRRRILAVECLLVFRLPHPCSSPSLAPSSGKEGPVGGPSLLQCVLWEAGATQCLILQGHRPVGTWVTGVGPVSWHHPDAVAQMSFPDTQADPLLWFRDCVMSRKGRSLMNHLEVSGEAGIWRSYTRIRAVM